MEIQWWMWLAWIGIGFIMEMVAVFNKHPNDTLSAFLIQHVPVVVIMAGIAWLAHHFLTRDKGKMRTPRPEEGDDGTEPRTD